MTEKKKLGAMIPGLAIFLVLVLCVAILPVAPLSANGTTVGIVIDPTPVTVTVNDTFSVDIKVTISGGEAVNSAEAHIDFNPVYLEVVNINAGTALPTPLQSTFNNTLGTIDYGAGAQLGGTAPTADFVLATLHLKAKAVTAATPLIFVFDLPLRKTATYAGMGVDSLDHNAVIDGSVTAVIGAGIMIEPAVKIVAVSDTFSVDIKVAISQSETVSYAEACIDFDPTYLEVVSITAGSALPTLLQSTFNNTLGTIDYGAGAQLEGTAPTTDFVLATVNLKAKAVTNATALTFVYEPPARKTKVVVGSYDILSHAAVVDGSVQVLLMLVGDLSGHLELQRAAPAPNDTWISAVTVVFFQPGTNNVVRTANVTSDNGGNFTVAEIQTGTYDIGVKCPRSLSALVSGVTFVVATVTAVTFGPLPEGDANNDDAISGVDYAYLYTYWKAESGAGLEYCDFNCDGIVGGEDYSLLWMNFGQKGDMCDKWP